jgi:chemotaxis protein MotB
MQANGVGEEQVTQVRGFADQRLRKPDNPLDASNRRISLIVQYIVKNDEEDAKPSAAGEPKKSDDTTPAAPPPNESKKE